MNAVYVFIQEGCPACHEYLPRFEHVAASFAGRFPIGIYDLAKENHARSFATRLEVKATPTTVVMAGGRLHHYVGALPNPQIAALLRRAAY